MFTTDNSRSLVFFNTITCLISNKKSSKQNVHYSTLAMKKEKKALFPLKLSNTRFLIQSAAGVFALGFIDAGYSGDWSRIGVISRGTEDLLKYAAFLVVPFCLFLILFLSKKDSEE